MQLYRIADSRHPIWDGTGAAMVGGRWNSPGRPVIYASLSYACAMLEILVHANIGRIPATQAYVVAEVPDNVFIERHDVVTHPQEGQTDVYPIGILRLFRNHKAIRYEGIVHERPNETVVRETPASVATSARS